MTRPQLGIDEVFRVGNFNVSVKSRWLLQLLRRFAAPTHRRMLKAVTRQNRSAPQLAKRLSPTKDSLGAPSLKSVDEDVEVAIGSASQELLEQLQVFADEDEEKWEAMRQIVGLGLESISGSVLALISRIADELQLSLREKLKEGIKANEEKLDRARKAGEMKVEEVKADYRGRELSQLEIEQKIVERILSAVGAGSGEEKDGEPSEILTQRTSEEH